MKKQFELLITFFCVCFVVVSGDLLQNNQYPDDDPPLCHWGPWGDYGDCIDGLMNRLRICFCDDEPQDPRRCPIGVPFSDTVDCKSVGNGLYTEGHKHQDFILENGGNNEEMSIDEEDDEELSSNMTKSNHGPTGSSSSSVMYCGWKWGRWLPCSQFCGENPVGTTFRVQECWCLGMNTPHEDETQCSQAGPKQNETVPCNNFPCSSIRPQNKLYWQALYEGTRNMVKGDMDMENTWPFPTGTTFPCTRGDSFLFSLKKWSDVIEDPPYPENAPWHFLAKEYIANRLNRARGCLSEEEADEALEEAQYLLAKCDGYTPDETIWAYATKEKLSRANNGIGGLSDVDRSLGLAVDGGGTGGTLRTPKIYVDVRSLLVSG